MKGPRRRTERKAEQPQQAELEERRGQRAAADPRMQRAQGRHCIWHLLLLLLPGTARPAGGRRTCIFLKHWTESMQRPLPIPGELLACRQGLQVEGPPCWCGAGVAAVLAGAAAGGHGGMR